jgi:EAL domain-containing protein (putative c-di-GMP-specific phosphodiesterase class I)/GGDEF domain-containing protein
MKTRTLSFSDLAQIFMHPDDDAKARLESLIRDHAVVVVFQPIVDLNDGLVSGYEALCRPREGYGFRNADDMFDAAERHGLLWDLERITRSMAMDAAAGWPKDVRLFLNSSPSVFADDRFAELLEADLSSVAGLTSDRIVLEITERSEHTVSDRLETQVDLAKRAGFHVAIDDAGAGTSGLNRMMQLRPNWIKLDRQLVSGIHADPFKQNLVRFFIHFARMSGVSVIAEGIEEPEELGSLIGLGVRYAQGYYLGRPGERSQTMDPTFIAHVRERWAAVDGDVPSEPLDLPLVRLARPVISVEVGPDAIHHAVSRLAQAPEAIGVVTTEGRRMVGWLDRATLPIVGDAALPDALRASMATPVVCTLSPETSVLEAIQLVCTREDHDLATPLIITAGSHVVGAVRLRDLLRMAATEARSRASMRVALTGLPARVRADQHIEHMICRASDPVLRRSVDFHADGAFIDIRRFADYNGAFGYEMGDRLIRALSEQITAIFRPTRTPAESFVAHLGDDRFFITSVAGRLELQLHTLMESFGKLSCSLADTASGASAMGLRVLFMPGVFDQVVHPRDVYRIETLLRQRARHQEMALRSGESIMMSERTYAELRHERRAA